MIGTFGQLIRQRQSRVSDEWSETTVLAVWERFDWR